MDPFDEVKASIAEELRRQELLGIATAKYANDELFPAWKEGGAPPQAMLDARGLRVRSTGPIPTVQVRFNPLAPPQIMLDQARTAEVGAVLAVVEQGGAQYVGQLTARQDPDMEAFEADKLRIREQSLQRHRYEFLQRWVDSLKAESTIE